MRRMIAFVVMMVLMVFSSAFAETIDPMEEIRTALDVMKIISENESVSVNRIYYDPDGSEMFSTFLFAKIDENGNITIVSEDSEGNVEILSEYASAGFDAWSMKLYVMGFLMDEYEENMNHMVQNFFADVRLSEKFFSRETNENTVTVTTKSAYMGDFEGGCDVLEYVFEDGMLSKINEYFEDADGSRTLNSVSFIRLNTAYDLSGAITRMFETDEVRMIYVHAAEGEETYAFTAPVDKELILIYPEEYILYEDEDHTRMFAGETADEFGQYPAETHLYMAIFG